eukprot:PITA_09133
MDKIQHKQVNVGGLNLHVAEIGSGPAVLLLHGFPEIWYSWRHQMIALAEAGFHAIAPDFRGYGLSEQPSEPEKAGFYDLVEDMVGLLDALGIDKVLVVGKDFGAVVAYYLDLCHPDRVKGIVTLGIPYLKPGGLDKWDSAPKGLYFRHWQPSWNFLNVSFGFINIRTRERLGRFGRFDVKAVVRNIYTLFSSCELPVAEDGKEVMDLYDPSKPLPPWFNEDDLQMYSSLYEKSGFVFPMQVPYLCSKRDPGRLTLFSEHTIQAPSLLIMGTKDYFLKFPGVEYYVNSEMLKSAVPNLEIKFFPKGSHFVQEQFPEEVNKLLLGFLNQHL